MNNILGENILRENILGETAETTETNLNDDDGDTIYWLILYFISYNLDFFF